jgi:S-formylglutathione hydrolase
MRCPWGRKAFSGYLGGDEGGWRAYDSTELVSHSTFHGPILIDQGEADKFLAEQLKPELFADACRRAGQTLELRIGRLRPRLRFVEFVADHGWRHASA